MFHKLPSRKVQKAAEEPCWQKQRKWKGTVVVEASYLVPFTLVLYGMIILLAAVLLVRCLSSQNRFLQSKQQERYIDFNRSEVIYADWLCLS